MKKTFAIIIACIIMCATPSYSQDKREVKREGNTISLVKGAKETQKPVETGLFYEGKGGEKYPIYKSSKGSFYILRVSKKTGKEYKYYLPKEVQEELKKG